MPYAYLKTMSILFFGMTFAVKADAEQSALGFCIPPQQSPTELAKRWTPVLQYLTEKSGLSLQFKTAKDIPTYQQQVIAGQCDIAYMSANNYVTVSKAQGYRAFAKEKDGKSSAVIVAHRDGSIKHLSQLSGQTLAFPSSSAFMATVLPMKKLEAEKLSINVQYVISIDSVYRSVAKGLFVAGGGESRTYGALSPEMREQLTLLWESEELPPFPFFAHPRVGSVVVSKLQNTMLEMSYDVNGQALLKAVNIKALAKAEDAEYNALRKLNLPTEIK